MNHDESDKQISEAYEELRRTRMLTRLRYYKDKMNITCTEIAKRSGIPESTVKKVMSGITKHPRKRTVEEIAKVLRLPEILQECREESGELYALSDPAYLSEMDTRGMSASLADTSEADEIGYMRGNNGNCTIDDYYALPDDHRAQLIDGVIYDMLAPSVLHQRLALDLCYKFRSFIEKNKGKCEVLISPIDVQIDRDSKTILQPDVIVVCDPDKIKKNVIFGAPDFVAEILSPSTRLLDKTLKMWKYSNTGVREYWVIDPHKQEVSVYFWEEDDDCIVYKFSEEIPVQIYDGKLSINLKDFANEVE